MVHVPYKGTGPALADLVAGRTHVMFEQLPALHAHIRSGKLKALAVAAPARSAQLPEVPTSAEAGVPGYEVSAWFGLLAPAGTPKDIIARLSNEARRALATKEIQDSFAKHGIEPVGSTPEEFAALIVAEAAKWSRAVRLSGAKLE